MFFAGDETKFSSCIALIKWGITHIVAKRMFIVCCPLAICMLSVYVFFYLLCLSVVCRLLSVFWCQLSVFCYLFNIVCFLLSVVHYLLYVTLCLLFNVCCISVGFTGSELLSDISCITIYFKCISCWYQHTICYPEPHCKKKFCTGTGLHC